MHRRPQSLLYDHRTQKCGPDRSSVHAPLTIGCYSLPGHRYPENGHTLPARRHAVMSTLRSPTGQSQPA
ncbi:hypothetical protein QNH99_12380 [Pantoea allii]|uniref:hypothetical protein n=1 Tax=Pantoea allii TaxID=574096 RepID=UPI003977966F